MKFNINDSVRVRLTDHGRAILLQAQLDNLERGRPACLSALPTEDADGWSKWQLWDLMQTFGNWMGVGKKIPFETTIDLVVPQGRCR